jgi:hypothetical protein
MKLLTLLFLTGCTTQTVDDLYAERTLCVSSGGECGEIELKLQRREEIIRRADNAKAPNCPDGFVAYCDERDRGCGDRFPQRPVRYKCISRDQFREMEIWGM